MIYQPDPQEIVRRQLLAQSIDEEPLPSGFYHDYDEEAEDLIDLEVEDSFIDHPPPTPISIAGTDSSEAALRDSFSDRTASPPRFQPEDESVGAIRAEVYEEICEFFEKLGIEH